MRKINDIALLKLNDAAKLEQKNIATICLPFGQPKLPKNLVVVGFGLIEFFQNNSELRKGTLDVIENVECEREYMKFDVDKKMMENQFCALGTKEKMRKGVNKTYDVDTCPG